MEHQQPRHLKTGKIGEDLACNFLKQKGYLILERNFRRKWGEIDIICYKTNAISKIFCSMWNKNLTNVLHGTDLVFVEVKTLNKNSFIDPEDNLTQNKQKKLIRTCELYISEKNLDPDMSWRIDAILVSIDTLLKKANVKHIKSAIY